LVYKGVKGCVFEQLIRGFFAFQWFLTAISSAQFLIFVLEKKKVRSVSMKKQFLCVCFLLIQFCCSAQINPASYFEKKEKDSPVNKSSASLIECIQTETSGAITIHWAPTTDPLGTFIDYQIHTIENGLMASFSDINTSSYTAFTVSGALQYYLLVIGDTPETSDTVSNIFLSLSNTLDGTATLQWNDPIASILPSMSNFYHIYREFPTGTWVLRDSVPYGTHFYKDTIDICQAFLNYQIVLPNQPCSYTSNSVGANFEDLITPDIPTITQVTIDTLTNKVEINWTQNNQPDTYGYIVYSVDGNGFPSEIDTVWGLSNTSYSFFTNISVGPLSFSIAAFDSCFTTSVVPTYQTSAKADLHTSLFLRKSLSICDRKIKLFWTPYIGWNDLYGYEVWGHKSGEAWTLFGSTTALEYSVVGEALQDYCFAVKAVSLSEVHSFSNTVCLKVVSPSQPAFHYLKVATVSNNNVELRHLVEVVKGVQSVVFQRRDSDGLFTTIGQINSLSTENSWTDTDVLVDRFSYVYRAVVVDSCGDFGSISNTAQTILLKVKTDDLGMTHTLNWSTYGDFQGSLLGYNVYRGFNGLIDSQPLALLPKSQLSFQDNSSQFPATSGKTCYYVEAEEGPNLYGFKERSQSNTVCPSLSPLIYAPNSFTPNGDDINAIFQPILTFYDFASYRLTIYDRWEHPIFESNQIENGWNGEIKSSGKMANPGTYLYLLSFKNGEGTEVIRRGHVNLLK
jgi:gliding motility-associated-like protein